MWPESAGSSVICPTDADAGRVGDGLFFPLLLLLRHPLAIDASGVMHRTGGLGAHLTQLALIDLIASILLPVDSNSRAGRTRRRRIRDVAVRHYIK